MIRIGAVVILLSAAFTCSGCLASSGSSAPSSCDVHCQSDIAAACAGQCAGESPSVDPGSPEGVTCSDWTSVLSKDTKALLVEDYLNKYGDPNVSADEDAAVQVIDTTCEAYGDKETPDHIMKVTIASLAASNGH